MKSEEWLDKWQDEHDLGGITVGQIKADLAAAESLAYDETGRPWKDRWAVLKRGMQFGHAEAVIRADTAEAEVARLREIVGKLVKVAQRARDDFAGPVAELCEIINVHPFTLAITDLDAACAAAGKEGGGG